MKFLCISLDSAPTQRLSDFLTDHFCTIAIGKPRSLTEAIRLPALSSVLNGGLWSGGSLGSIAVAGWQRISRTAATRPRRSFSLPPFA